MNIKTLELTKKRYLISLVKKGKVVGHPVYVEKSILFQLWEKVIFPLLLVALGIFIGVVFG